LYNIPGKMAQICNQAINAIKAYNFKKIPLFFQRVPPLVALDCRLQGHAAGLLTDRLQPTEMSNSYSASNSSPDARKREGMHAGGAGGAGGMSSSYVLRVKSP
jgi:hypothetical protein